MNAARMSDTSSNLASARSAHSFRCDADVPYDFCVGVDRNGRFRLYTARLSMYGDAACRRVFHANPEARAPLSTGTYRALRDRTVAITGCTLRWLYRHYENRSCDH